MRTTKLLSSVLPLALCAGTLTSCSAVLGFEDLSLAESDASVTPDANLDAGDAGSDVDTADVNDDVSSDVSSDVSDDVASDAPPDGWGETGTDARDAEPDVADAAHEEAGCGDTTSNPDHCGRCDHSCLGGECVDGVCQPFVLTTVTDGAWGLAVDDTSLVVAIQLNNQIFRLDKFNGAELAREEFAPTVVVPSWVAIDGQSYYWTNRTYGDGSVGACPLTGCSGDPPLVVTPADRPNGIVADGAKIYWVETDGGTVNRANPDGTAAEVLAGASTSMRPFLLALHGGFVYFTDLEGQQVARVPSTGGTVETMGTSSKPYDVAVTDDWVYWTNGESLSGGVYRVPNTTPPAGGHPAEAVAGNQDVAFGIAVDDDNVYWIASAAWLQAEGALRYCPIAGCPNGQPITMDEGVPYPIDVVADSDALYYSIHGIDSAVDGAIRKVAKP